MEFFGYAGGNAYVDLTDGSVRVVPLDIEVAKLFIGGIGMAAWEMYKAMAPGMDPISPSNPIIISAGPLLGTPLPAASETVVMTKFPQTGAISPGKSGGRFGPMLKYAGYDNLILSGKALNPVYLKIDDYGVEIVDASDIWGMDIHQVTDELWRRHGREYSVIAIGPAGENLVKISLALVDKLQTLGKGGLGAVLGSKKVKAIMAYGTRGIRVAKKRFQNLVYQELRRFMRDPLVDQWIEFGTMNFQSRTMWYRKNYTEIQSHKEAEALGVYGMREYLQKAKISRLACFSCPGGCKDFFELRDEEFMGFKGFLSTLHGRLSQFVNRCNVGSFSKALVCADLCNRLGLCIHNATALIDWFVELYERGVITREDTDGIELKRDFPTTMQLMRKIAFREGLGDLLAEGYAEIFKRLGRECEKYAVHIKGMDVNFDARINRLGTCEFHEVVNPRGGHQQVAVTEGEIFLGHGVNLDSFKGWCRKVGIPEEAISRIFDLPGRFNLARLTKWSEDWWTLLDSVGWGCYYHSRIYRMEQVARAFSLATGIQMPAHELLRAGERAYTLLKALNAREGFGRKDDRFPERWFEPILDNDNGTYRMMVDYFGNEVKRHDAEQLLNDYYEERGWDTHRGIPTREKLVELGLEKMADDLERRG